MKKLLALLLVAIMIVPSAIGVISVLAEDAPVYTDVVDLMPQSESAISSADKAGYSLVDGRLSVSRTADSTVAWPSIAYDVNKEVDLAETPYLHLDLETSGVGDRGANGHIFYKVVGVDDASEVDVQLTTAAINDVNDFRDTTDMYFDFAKYLGITEKIIITRITLSVYGGVGETIYWNHLAFAKEAEDEPEAPEGLIAAFDVNTAAVYAAGSHTVLARIGENKTVQQINGYMLGNAGKDYNYFYVYAVEADEDGDYVITAEYETLGAGEGGPKSNVEVPENGYLVCLQGSGIEGAYTEKLNVGNVVVFEGFDPATLSTLQPTENPLKDVGKVSFFPAKEAEEEPETPAGPTNVALGKKVDVKKADAIPQYSGADLTDGVAANSMSWGKPADEWFSFYYNSEYADQVNVELVDNMRVGTAVVDLADFFELSSVRIHFNASYVPETTEILISADGETYTSVSKKTTGVCTSQGGTPTEGTTVENGCWIEFPIEGTAQYVKIVVTFPGMFAMLNEIEVYGVPGEEPGEDPGEDPGEEDTGLTIHFTQAPSTSTATGSITLFPAGDEDLYVASEVAGMRWSTALIVNADGTIVSVARQLLSEAQDDKNAYTDHGFTIPAGGCAIVYHAGDNSELHKELQAYTLALCTEVGLAKDGAYTFWNSVVSVEEAGWAIAIETEGGDYGFGYATLYEGAIPGGEDPGEDPGDDPGEDPGDDPIVTGPTLTFTEEEVIDVDGELNDTGYDMAEWIENGFWMYSNVPEEEVSGMYTVRTDDENIYIALVVDGAITPYTTEKYVDGGAFAQDTATDIRIWLKKDVENRTFFDLQFNGEEFTLANWNTTHEAVKDNVQFVVNYKDGKLVAEICVPMADVDIEDSFYLLVSYCETFNTGYNGLHITSAEELSSDYWAVTNTSSYTLYTVADLLLGEYEYEVLIGDLLMDGSIDGTDYLLLKRFVLGTFELSEDQLLLADINHDEKVNSIDYMLLKRAVMRLFVIA